MKERPILFSDAMVRALVAGTKTQTRRIVKPQPVCRYGHPFTEAGRFVPDDGEPGSYGGLAIHSKGTSQCYKCPYAQRIGDRLWVREAWAETYVLGMPAPITVYRAYDTATDYGGPWKPSIHMNRWRSRITLEITGVRAERLQEISHRDACAEGWPDESCADGISKRSIIEATGDGDDACIEWYADLWETINGPGSWDANPWVWVLTFGRVS